MSQSLAHDRDTNAPPPPAPLSPEQVVAYLDYLLEPLLRRRDDEIIPALARTLAAHPRIDDGDEDTAGLCAENARMAKALIGTGEKNRKDHKEPYLEGGRAVDAWFRRFAEPIQAAVAPVERVMFDYATRKETAQRALAERLRREAEAEAQRRAAEAAAAMKRNPVGQDVDAKLDAAAASAAEADRAADEAQARPAEFSRSRGIYGAVASLRSSWSWELQDMMALARAVVAGDVPPGALAVNESWVRERAKERDRSGKPTAIVPGIAWVESRKIGVR
jgi:hypothetical protein